MRYSSKRCKKIVMETLDFLVKNPLNNGDKIAIRILYSLRIME